MSKTVTMWVYTYNGYYGVQIAGARTKRETTRHANEMRHHPVGEPVKVVLPAPVPQKGRECNAHQARLNAAARKEEKGGRR